MATEITKKGRGRPRIGSVSRHGDHLDVRVMLADDTRSPPRCLPPGTSRARAREIALALTERELEKAKGREPSPPPASETWAAWAERWFAWRDSKGMSSVKEDRGHFHRVPADLKARPMAGEGKIERIDLERIVEQLDEIVQQDEISWKTAKNTWGTFTKMFADACTAKRLALRVRADNPAAGIVGPDEGATKSKTYLYPPEFLKLVAHRRTPVRWRRVFTLATYFYPRPGELEALHLEDIDLDRRIAHIHRAIDRTDGGLKETKTKVPRRIPIEFTLVPLLRQMIKEAQEEGEVRLLRMPPECDLSERLRQYLRWAGVDRAELHVTDKTRQQMTFYGLRATGITWMALRGDEPLRIQQRAGHKEFKTTQGYIRAAEELEHSISSTDVFPALPPEVFSSGISSEGASVWGLMRPGAWEKAQERLASPAGFEPASAGDSTHSTAFFPQETHGSGPDAPPQISATDAPKYAEPRCPDEKGDGIRRPLTVAERDDEVATLSGRLVLLGLGSSPAPAFELLGVTPGPMAALELAEAEGEDLGPLPWAPAGGSR